MFAVILRAVIIAAAAFAVIAPQPAADAAERVIFDFAAPRQPVRRVAAVSFIFGKSEARIERRRKHVRRIGRGKFENLRPAI